MHFAGYYVRAKVAHGSAEFLGKSLAPGRRGRTQVRFRKNALVSSNLSRVYSVIPFLSMLRETNVICVAHR